MVSDELIAAFTSGTIEDVECILQKNGISARNTDNSFRRFDEVMNDLNELYKNS